MLEWKDGNKKVENDHCQIFYVLSSWTIEILNFSYDGSWSVKSVFVDGYLILSRKSSDCMLHCHDKLKLVFHWSKLVLCNPCNYSFLFFLRRNSLVLCNLSHCLEFIDLCRHQWLSILIGWVHWCTFLFLFFIFFYFTIFWELPWSCALWMCCSLSLKHLMVHSFLLLSY
jgi:hypothetical protein